MNVLLNYHQHFSVLHFLICLLSFLDHICSAGLVARLLVRHSFLFLSFFFFFFTHYYVKTFGCDLFISYTAILGSVQ